VIIRLKNGKDSLEITWGFLIVGGSTASQIAAQNVPPSKTSVKYF
jgi:hypothetical protein